MLSIVHLLILFLRVGLVCALFFCFGFVFCFVLEKKFRNGYVALNSLVPFFVWTVDFLKFGASFYHTSAQRGLINKGNCIDFVGHVSAFQLNLVLEVPSCHLSGYISNILSPS